MARGSEGPDGVLVIDKPSGMTSHDVVAVIRKRLGTKKVGHGGTLDPDATGLLIVGVGRATRFLGYAQVAPKSYRAEASFGVTTTTQDASGEVMERSRADISEDDVRAALPAFTGEIKQIPPMVSAVKVGGERLYKKALRGEEVERAPRAVTIHAFDLISFTPGDEPRAVFDVSCSGGTYVRTLVHDLGAQLGCGAHLVSLRRTAAGPFTEGDAVPLDDVTTANLRPLADAVHDLPHLEADEVISADVAHGRAFVAPDGLALKQDALVAIVQGGELLAVYRRAGDRLAAERVVPR